MSTTITTAATNVKTRLGVGTGGAVGSSTDPTDSVVQGWVRDAFKQLLGDLPPIKRGSATISSNAVTLPNDRVFAVAVGFTPLIAGSEYFETTTGITFRAGHNGETATYYYVSYPDVSQSTVDTTCYFGPDWLEELATVMAAQQVCLRLGGAGASQAPNEWMGTYRVLEDERTRLYTQHKATLDAFLAQLLQLQQARVQFGKRPLPESAFAGLRNLSRVTNPLLGRE